MGRSIALLTAALAGALLAALPASAAPVITSVSAIGTARIPGHTIRIRGSGFGEAPEVCSPLPAICDSTEKKGIVLFDGSEFSAGFRGHIPAGTYGTLVLPPHTSFTDTYQLRIDSWSPTEIVLGGIDYEGSSSCCGILADGDAVSIFVFNEDVASGTCTVIVDSGTGCNENAVDDTSLVAAVLPASRSVQVGATASAFATIINTGSTTGASCTIAPSLPIAGTFLYQTTNPTTNALTGSANTPVDIAAGATQSFVIALTPTAAFNATDVGFSFACANASAAPAPTGLNTLLASASTSPVPDVVALVATAQNDGILHITGTSGSNAFAVATVNLGSASAITASINTGDATLPLGLTLCQTNPASGQCISPIGATVTTTIAADATPTFAIFGTASGAIPFDPADSRIFVQFSDSTGAVRGETSVAIETQ
jgi:hypothetical protein